MRCGVHWAVDVRRHIRILIPAESLRQNAPKRFDVSERLEWGHQRRRYSRENRRVPSELLCSCHARLVVLKILQILFVFRQPPDLILGISLLLELVLRVRFFQKIRSVDVFQQISRRGIHRSDSVFSLPQRASRIQRRLSSFQCFDLTLNVRDASGLTARPVLVGVPCRAVLAKLIVPEMLVGLLLVKLVDLLLQLFRRPLHSAQFIRKDRLPVSLFLLRIPPFQLPVELIQPDQAAVVLPGIRRRLLGSRSGLHLALLLTVLFLQCPAVPAHLIVVDGVNDLVLPLLHRPEVSAQLVMVDRICDLLVLLIRRLIALRRRFLGVRPVIRIIRAVLDVLPAAACLILPQSIKPAAPRSAGAACVSCLLVFALRLPSAPRLILPQSIKPCAFLRHIVLLIPSGFRSPPCSGC